MWMSPRTRWLRWDWRRRRTMMSIGRIWSHPMRKQMSTLARLMLLLLPLHPSLLMVPLPMGMLLPPLPRVPLAKGVDLSPPSIHHPTTSPRMNLQCTMLILLSLTALSDTNITRAKTSGLLTIPIFRLRRGVSYLNLVSSPPRAPRLY